jgi:hypothetical protein
MNKTIKLRVTFTSGRIGGFGLGISISKWFTTIDLGFWYIGIEY